MAIKNGEVYSSNNCGDFEVVNYVTARHIDIQFINTGYVKTVRADHIRSGSIKDPRHPSILGIGYLGEGKYKPSKDKKAYTTWVSMFTRCYSDEDLYRNYIDCTVAIEWHDFQNFCSWFYDNYTPGYQLDKDTVVHGNTVYSPDTCVFLSHADNTAAARVTGNTYIVRHPTYGTAEFTNQKRFSEEYSLSRSEVSNLVNGKVLSVKGWSLV